MSHPEYRTLRLETRGRVASITLHRPERRNAIDRTMARELPALLGRIAADPELRVVVLRGSGGHFSSGGDLAPDADDDGVGDDAAERAEGARRQRSGAAVTHDLMHGSYADAALAVHRLSKPVIAAVEGTAAGAGANLAFGCDLVLAHESARFAQIFVRRGLSLDLGGSWLLPRLIGLQRAKELAFYGDWIDAPTAERLGLVNRVFDDADFADGVEDWARRLATRAPQALAVIKHSLNRSLGGSFAEALDQEAVAQGMVSSTRDFAEGMQAFVERREPRFEDG